CGQKTRVRQSHRLVDAERQVEELQILPSLLLGLDMQLFFALVRGLRLGGQLLLEDVFDRDVLGEFPAKTRLLRVGDFVVEDGRVADIEKLSVELFHGLRVDLAALGQPQGSGPAAGPMSGRLTVFTNSTQVVVLRALADGGGEVVGVVALADRQDPGHAPTSLRSYRR